MANKEFEIAVQLKNCTADTGNPVKIEEGGEAVLEFTANIDYPYNTFLIGAKGASYEIDLADDKKSLTVTLSNPTKDVDVTIEAVISSTLNERYVVENGILYKIYNNRKYVRWNKRWIRKDMI